MAARKHRSSAVDYAQLNSLSSVVLYDTRGKNSMASRFYEAERIIERRKVRYDNEYLIKWRGWPLEDCTWEPSENLSVDLLRSFENPIKPTDEKLQVANLPLESSLC